MSGAVDVFVGSGQSPQLTITSGENRVTDVNPVTSTFTLSNTGSGWLSGGYAGNYDVRATLAGGVALTSGTLGSWLNLATSRSWSLTKNTGLSGTTRESDILLEFVSAGTTTPVLKSVTINIIAETA